MNLPKPIPNVGQWHKLWSMRLAILTTAYSAAAGAYVTLPADWVPHIPDRWRIVLAIVGCALPALTAASRLVAQPKLQQPENPS
jgi:hypothetical protein